MYKRLGKNYHCWFSWMLVSLQVKAPFVTCKMLVSRLHNCLLSEAHDGKSAARGQGNSKLLKTLLTTLLLLTTVTVEGSSKERLQFTADKQRTKMLCIEEEYFSNRMNEHKERPGMQHGSFCCRRCSNMLYNFLSCWPGAFLDLCAFQNHS